MSFWVGSGNIETLDTTLGTKHVLSGMSPKCVGCQCCVTLEKLKILGWNNEVSVWLLLTN